MPIHDWTRVDAGIFHHFHHDWISELAFALNSGMLPSEYYAMAEHQAAGFGPDILTLQTESPDPPNGESGGGLLLAAPKVAVTAESSNEFFRRKKSTIVVRHISDDRIIAVVELISPGNKSSRNAFRALLDKAFDLLEHKVHLLIIDLFPPTKRDPNGLHAALWEEIANEEFTPPAGKPLTLASYESGLTVKAYVEPLAIGDRLADMPLFLEPGAHVLAPLEATYQTAFAKVPRRWANVLMQAQGEVR